jgi:hypothetical protein
LAEEGFTFKDHRWDTPMTGCGMGLLV